MTGTERPQPTGDDVAAEEATLSSTEVRRKAAAGAVLVMMRGVAVRAIALLGNIVLARLLLPHDFGIVAAGLAVMMVVSFVTDAGLGAVLIRRDNPPTARDLRTLLTVPLLGVALCSVVIAALAPMLGGAGGVILVMCLSLLVRAVRGPGIVLLERDLDYRSVVVVEVTDAVAFYLWAVPAVLLGWGVWGPATATIAQAAVGTLVLLSRAPSTPRRPLLDWRLARRLLRASLAFQGVSWVVLLRDQALNAAAVVAGGPSMLGLWSLASRLMQLPNVLLEALWRISYPAMSRLHRLGEDPAPVIAKALRITNLGAAIMLVPLAAAGPALVPVVFGPAWAPAAGVLPAAAGGIFVSAPLSAVLSSYFYSIDRFNRVLLALTIQACLWIGVAAVLLPLVGVIGMGLGWLVGGVVEGVVLARVARQTLGSLVAANVLPVSCVAVVAAGTGWLAAEALGQGWAGGLAGAVVSLALLAAGTLVLDRRAVHDTFSVVHLVRAGGGRSV
jgi:O-antigen/teichoic acid export membrane protein